MNQTPGRDEAETSTLPAEDGDGGRGKPDPKAPTVAENIAARPRPTAMKGIPFIRHWDVAAGVVLAVAIAAGGGAWLSELLDRPAAETVAAIAALEGRVDGLRDDLAAQQVAREALDGFGAELEAFRAELGGFGATLEGFRAALEAGRGRAEALGRRLDTLQAEPDGMTASDLAAVNRRIAAMDSRLAALAARLDASSTAAPGIPPDTGIDELRQQLGALDGRLARLDGAVSALGERRSDPALPGGPAKGHAAYALALGQLREAVLAGGAYGNAWETVAALAPENAATAAALEALEARRDTGIASRERLRDALSAAAFAAIDAERVERADDWIDETIAEVLAIVSIRRVDGEIEGDDAPAVTARADARLRQGDLRGAIAEMEGLTGMAGEAAAGWLALAGERARAEAALDALSAEALALIGGESG